MPPMDPLSASASRIEILGGVTKVSRFLNSFLQSYNAAPERARIVLCEINVLNAILTQLQTQVSGTATPSKSGASLVSRQQVVVTLTECFIILSELRDALGTLGSGGAMRKLDRVKWIMKKSKIAAIQKSLQRIKSSLNLMLTVVQWFVAPIPLRPQFRSPNTYVNPRQQVHGQNGI